MATSQSIHFYRTNDPFGEFSNFAAFPINLKGVIWPTTEHYFQAQKFAGTPHEEVFRLTSSPMIVAKMGRDRSLPLRPDWETVKDDIMREAVMAKFEQHPSLKALLLSTGDAHIIEHTKNDAYWADGGDGSGLNMLGHILMDVRQLLRDRPHPSLLEPSKFEAGLRQVTYVRHEYHYPSEKITNTLLAFIYDIPYFDCRGFLPPLHLMNEQFLDGGGDGGMSPGASWEPFSISPDEYSRLIAAIASVPLDDLRNRARYTRSVFKLDPTLDHYQDYKVWSGAVRDKYRAKE